MRAIQLTQTAQGFRDIWWCDSLDDAVFADRHNQCPHCCISLKEDKWDHQFIAHIQKGDDSKNPLLVLAECSKDVVDTEAEIEILRDAINGFAQQVHQAYHGATPPDLSNVTHVECPRGLCRSVQHVLDPRRPRGKP